MFDLTIGGELTWLEISGETPNEVLDNLISLHAYYVFDVDLEVVDDYSCNSFELFLLLFWNSTAPMNIFPRDVPLNAY